MSLCFILFNVLLPLSFPSRFLPLLLLSSLLSLSVFLRHSGIFLNGAMLESSSSFSFQIFHLSCFNFISVSIFLMRVGKSPSTFLSLSLPPPSLVLLSLLWFLCVVIVFRLLIVNPYYLRFNLFSRLLTVVAMSFLTAIFAFVLRLLLLRLGI